MNPVFQDALGVVLSKRSRKQDALGVVLSKRSRTIFKIRILWSTSQKVCILWPHVLHVLTGLIIWVPCQES